MSIYSNFISADRKCRRKFLVNMGWKGFLGFRKYRRRLKNGFLFPAFQFISITYDCNLRCQGCWVTADGTPDYMPLEKINSVIEAGKRHGSYFNGILGGEPLMHPDLMEIFRAHPDCYFQLFTNGTMLTRQTASELRSLGNITPLISFEGDEVVADTRRGGHNIFNRTMEAIRNAVSEKLITGVAVSVCKSNIDMALSDEFVNMLHDMGVLYLWYYIYRPAGSNPSYELALDQDEICRLREFLVEGRNRFPMVLIDSYWSADGKPFCPAADGLSHHINAAGYIEPCPVLQIAADKINTGDTRLSYDGSEFLRDFREQIHRKTNGCVLMEDPAWVKAFSEKHHAMNTSNRPEYTDALGRAPQLPSHGSCPVLPEKNFFYRFAKRTAFFGMGAYG